ncbi:hypothetical protein B9T62_08470 [Paenibacillus donghaensis]|uniref:Uncharacterized protein n=1 Tax=Paenibacillus donghaensis TaxID=414771 RepID=A0A2Z2KB08_9BACL|nr:hypothetical protein B9T62_08470 [Paenibacillus donghaensis]
MDVAGYGRYPCRDARPRAKVKGGLFLRNAQDLKGKGGLFLRNAQDLKGKSGLFLRNAQDIIFI